MTGLSVAVMAVAAGCTRDPVGECAPIEPGEVIVTEFRGEQMDDDTLGIWVELYNTSVKTFDLEGVKVRFRKKDGSSEVPILVRRSVVLQPSSYVVLGLVPDDDTLPSHIDYGFADDFHQGYLPAAAVDVETCSVRVDRAVYDVLPKVGTYSYGGPLDTDSNDNPAMWCVNMATPGTPKMANPPCP